MKQIHQQASNSFIELTPLNILEYLNLSISSISQEPPEKQENIIGLTLLVYIRLMYPSKKSRGMPLSARKRILKEISQADEDFGSDLVHMLSEYFNGLSPRDKNKFVNDNGSELAKMQTKAKQDRGRTLPYRQKT